MALFDVDSPIERRVLLRRAGAAAALLPLGGLLSACGEVEAGANGDEPSGSGSAASDGASSGVDRASAGSAGSVLVAYFSATGNTAGIASAVAEHLGADTFEISPAQPYADADLNYNDDGSRVSQERASDARPELSQDIPDGFADYDIVFLGYPIWWGEAAWPLRTFVEANDFQARSWFRFAPRRARESVAVARRWPSWPVRAIGARGRVSRALPPLSMWPTGSTA